MKKIFTLCALMACGMLSASAQYSNIVPAQGKINLDVNESGITGFTFFLPTDAKVNTSENRFATLYFNGDKLAAVPTSNYLLISFDSLMEYNWTISFWQRPNALAMQAGSYKVVVDEGFFIYGEENTPTQKLELNYYIEPSEVDIYPLPGTVSSFQDLTLTFNEAVSIERNEEKLIEVFNLHQRETPTGGMVSYTPVVECEGNIANLYLLDEITQNGTWHFGAQAGAFKLTMANGSVIESPAIDENYVIPNHSVGKLTLSVKEGDIAFFPGVITVSLPWGKELGNVNDHAYTYVYPVLEDGSYGTAVAKYIPAKIKINDVPVLYDGYSFELRNLEKDSEGVPCDINLAPGNYVLVMGEMTFSTKDDPSYQSSKSFNYTVLSEDVNYVLTPNPDEIQNSLHEFTITFPDATTVELDNTGANWMCSDVYKFIFYPKAMEEGSKSVTFSTGYAISEKGTYVFQPVATAVKVDGKYISIAPAYQIDPEYSAVSGIAEDTVFDIYSIDGRLVKANATSIEGLGKGLYIAGGKKILVK